jgi:hypothetical protein
LEKELVDALTSGEHGRPRYLTLFVVLERIPAQDIPDGRILADGRNPRAELQLLIAEAHFKAMNARLPPEVWLH